MGNACAPMRIDWDTPVPMDDGIGLRCDIYRPSESGIGREFSVEGMLVSYTQRKNVMINLIH